MDPKEIIEVILKDYETAEYISRSGLIKYTIDNFKERLRYVCIQAYIPDELKKNQCLRSKCGNCLFNGDVVNFILESFNSNTNYREKKII